MTQGKAAALVGVSRATFAQWETARHLPAEERVHELDKLLRAGGELIAAAEQARPAHRLRPVDSASPAAATRSLLHVLGDTRRAFLAQLCTDENGQPTGWRHHLVPSDDPPSVLSTAYGLKVLAMLGGPDASTPAVVRWVLGRAVRDGEDRIVGWRASAQRAPRMEMTSAALDALLHAGVPFEVDHVVRMLKDLVDDSVRARPFIICSALDPILRVAHESDLATELVHMLLDCRVDFGGVLLWPEKLVHRDQPMLSPSLAHTARAVTVLRGAPEDLLGDAVRSAEDWVAEQDNFDGVSEIIRRDLADDQREELSIHHFTSTWVVRALAGVESPDHRLIGRALGHVWDRYDPNLHFWAWGNGDTPVWMLADAVAALQDAAFAFLPAPAGSDTG